MQGRQPAPPGRSTGDQMRDLPARQVHGVGMTSMRLVNGAASGLASVRLASRFRNESRNRWRRAGADLVRGAAPRACSHRVELLPGESRTLWVGANVSAFSCGRQRERSDRQASAARHCWPATIYLVASESERGPVTMSKLDSFPMTSNSMRPPETE
jgi:hypothetical protein